MGKYRHHRHQIEQTPFLKPLSDDGRTVIGRPQETSAGPLRGPPPMLKIPPRGPDPALDAEWSRVLTYGAKLFESLDRLGELGGCCRVAASHRWTPSDHDRAAGILQAVVEAA